MHLLCADVARQPLPAGPLVVFLYNPFPAGVLSAVLRSLSGRPARLVYVNPQHAPVVAAAGWREVASDPGGEDRSWRWQIYAPPQGEA